MGGPEKEVTSSVTNLFLSFLVSSSYPFQLEIPHVNYISELFKEVDLDTFLKEDQATLTRRGKQSVARVVGELWDYLQRECGEGEVLPNNVFRDVMLQVHVHTFSPSTLSTNPFLKPESALFTYFPSFSRESDRFKLVRNCRRWAVDTSMKAGLTSTMP